MQGSTAPIYAVEEQSRSSSEWRWYHLLPLAVVAFYMVTPILIWQTPIPGAVQWLGDALVMLMLVLFVINMLVTDRIPVAFLAVLAITVLGFVLAAFEGQGLAVTFWGWWMMFKWLVVGLYVYSLPDWPRSFARVLPAALVGILAIQVAGQVLLYLSGVRNFDHVAGTFGRFGVGELFQFLVLVIAINLGHWMVTGEWRLLIASLLLGGAASALGEMKVFVLAIPAMLVITVLLYLLRGGQTRKLIVFVVSLSLGVGLFMIVYNAVIVEQLGVPPIERLLEEDSRDRYLGYVRGDLGGTVGLGRNYEAQYGWQLLQQDLPRVLFGMGLGARQVNEVLGLKGVALSEGPYRLSTGRSLIVMMHEIGVVGMGILVIFFLVSSVILFRATRRWPDPEMDALRLGVIIFSAMWPLLIWYKASWILPASAALFWIVWGYAMHFSVGADKVNGAPE